MTSKTGRSEKTDELRRKAEKAARRDVSPIPENLDNLSPEEFRQILHELRVHQIELEAQNEELRQTQVKLCAERKRYFDFYDLAPVGYLSLNDRGLILEANFTAAILLGDSRGALINRPLSSFILPEDQDSYYLHKKKLSTTGRPQTYELRIVKKNRTIFWAQLATTAEQDVTGQSICRIVLSDITNRRFRDNLGALAAHLLTQIDTPDGLRQCLADLTTSLQGWSGCEAVGIRLRCGDDYPYYETRGFPPAFIEAESQLCSYGENGELLRDAAGDPMLDCMCGNILSGRFDPSRPCFTEYGSFWSNSTTDLLTGTTGADRPMRYRNRCNGAGYESLALIPLRNGKQIFGLLQFNDHRLDRFNLDLISHLEKMAITLAISLSRHQAEELLGERERRFRSIFENATAGYFFIDKEGRFKTVNRAWLQLHKYNSPEEIIGRHFSVTQTDDSRTSAAENVEQLLAGNPVTSGEFTRRCKDGSVGRHTFTANPVLQGGKVIGLEGFIIDITELKKTEEALRTSEQMRLQEQEFANARLREQAADLEKLVEKRTLELQETQKQVLHAEKLSAIGKLSASIAHEFNNPLQGILSILKGLKKRAILEEEDRVLLDAAIDESHRMRSMIHDLQDFYRPSAGKKQLTDVHTTLSLILLMLKSDFKGKRIRIELDFSKYLPQIQAVPDQLKQVFLNLLSNAADACHSPCGVITISTRQVGDRVAVAIKDNGIGIKPEAMDLIFQPFYTTKPEVKGTGLGLPVSYGIVQNHGGEIVVKSRPGEGSTFTVFLPISETS